jgi:hypothetical protein
VLFFFLLAVNLAAYLARRERGCMNVRVAGIGSERVRKRVEIHGTNILPRYRDNVGFVHVPVTVPLFSGHAGVTTPAGPFPKLVLWLREPTQFLYDAMPRAAPISPTFLRLHNS